MALSNAKVLIRTYEPYCMNDKQKIGFAATSLGVRIQLALRHARDGWRTSPTQFCILLSNCRLAERE